MKKSHCSPLKVGHVGGGGFTSKRGQNVLVYKPAVFESVKLLWRWSKIDFHKLLRCLEKHFYSKSSALNDMSDFLH